MKKEILFSSFSYNFLYASCCCFSVWHHFMLISINFIARYLADTNLSGYLHHHAIIFFDKNDHASNQVEICFGTILSEQVK